MYHFIFLIITITFFIFKFKKVLPISGKMVYTFKQIFDPAPVITFSGIIIVFPFYYVKQKSVLIVGEFKVCQICEKSMNHSVLLH